MARKKHKKQKKLDLFNPALVPPIWWEREDVAVMSTEQILSKLAGFGITITAEEFVAQASGGESAEALSEEWWQRYQVTAKDRDEDFPWMAAIELWKRLLPERPSVEVVADRIDEGYDAIEEQSDFAQACNHWLAAWEGLKAQLTSEMTRLEQIEAKYETSDLWIASVLEDLRTELADLAYQAPHTYGPRLAQFCREFVTQFAAESEEVLAPYLADEAEALFLMGERAEGEAKFVALAERWPDRMRTYSQWAESYWMDVDKPSPEDYARAVSLYEKALGTSKGAESTEVLDTYMDLVALHEKMGNEAEADRYDALYAELAERVLPAPSLPPAPAAAPPLAEPALAAMQDWWKPQAPYVASAHPGRNDPCWCGSGKKYKKCHLAEDEAREREQRFNRPA